MVDRTTKVLLGALAVAVSGLVAMQWWPEPTAEAPELAAAAESVAPAAEPAKPMIEEVTTADANTAPATAIDTVDTAAVDGAGLALTEEASDAVKAEISELESRIQDLEIQAADAAKLYELKTARLRELAADHIKP